MNERGYFGIGLYEPKFADNLGTLLRSAQAFGADFTFAIGERSFHKQASNTTRSYRHVPHMEYRDWDQAKACLPVERKMIAIETSGVPIAGFVHPERAVYLLGREDAGLPDSVIEQCDAVIAIPSRYCINVAVAGSIVLFDRISKRADLEAERREEAIDDVYQAARE